MAKIVTETARPQFATVRPGVREREEFPGEICQFQLDTENGTEGRMKVLTEEVLDQGTISRTRGFWWSRDVE